MLYSKVTTFCVFSIKAIVIVIRICYNAFSKVGVKIKRRLNIFIDESGDYAHFDLKQRQDIFWSIFFFSKRVKVKIHTIIVDKRLKNNKTQLNRELANGTNNFFNSISDYMNEFEKVVVYYDNGQDLKKLKKLINYDILRL